MGLVNHTKKLFLARARKKYNKSNFKSSRRWSRFIFTFFKDKKSLDILARSEFSLGNHSKASKRYSQASSLGFLLKNHYFNHFRCSIKIKDTITAYRIVILYLDSNIKHLKEIYTILDSYPYEKRIDIITQMNEISPIPDFFEDLLPWPIKGKKVIKLDSNYYNLGKSTQSFNIEKRELAEIKNSGEYRVGTFLSNNFRKPFLWPFIPFRLSKLIYQIYNEKKGIKSPSTNTSTNINFNSRDRECIILFPTNGVGFGHFTRLLSLAYSIREIKPDMEIVFVTTMPVLHILSEAGFPSYQLSGRKKYQDMDTSTWNSLTTELLSMVFSVHKPKAFIFDGSFPYRGVLNAISSEPNIKKFWVKRGNSKSKSTQMPVDSFNHFDFIISPRDIPSNSLPLDIVSASKVHHCPPITLVNSSRKQAKGQLKKRLGIPNEAMVCYIQLGAGNINDISSNLNMALEIASEIESLYVVIGESMLGSRININYPRARILRDYPNSIYFDDVDFSIMAAGYNSFHEVIKFGIPTICIPNLDTNNDDQLARALYGKEIGSMIVLKEPDIEIMRSAIERMTNRRLLNKMRKKAYSENYEDSTDEVSNWILSKI